MQNLCCWICVSFLLELFVQNAKEGKNKVNMTESEYIFYSLSQIFILHKCDPQIFHLKSAVVTRIGADTA